MANKFEKKQKLIAFFSRYAPIKKIIDTIHYQRRSPARAQLKSEGLKICSAACQALLDEDLTAFVYGGTLLGLIRDGKLIEYDDDIDIAVLADSNFRWESVQRAMTSIGCRPFRSFGFDGEITEQAFMYGHIGIDVFVMFPTDGNGRMYFYTYAENDSGNIVLRVKTLTHSCPMAVSRECFHGNQIAIPDNAMKLLEENYGTGWREPDPSFEAGSMWVFLDKETCFVDYEG